MSTILRDLRINPRYDLQSPYVSITYERTDTENGNSVLSLSEDLYPNPIPAGAQNRFNGLEFTVDLQGVQATGTKATLACDFLDIQNVGWWLKKHPSYMPCDPSNANDQANKEIQSFSIVPGTVTRRPSYAAATDKGFTNELRAPGTMPQFLSGRFGAQGIIVECMADVVYRKGERHSNLPLSFQCTSTNATSGTYQQQTVTQFGEPTPVGLAEQIYHAISILMYEGELTLQEQECSGSVSIGNLFNLINGANAAWSTMTAQVQKITENLDTGETSIDFGPPKHLSAGELVDLLRVNRHRIVNFSPNLQRDGQDPGGLVDQSGDPAEKNSAHAMGTANPHVVCADIAGNGPNVSHTATAGDIVSFWQAPNNPASVAIALSDAQGQQIKLRSVPVCINGVTQNVIFLCGPLPG